MKWPWEQCVTPCESCGFDEVPTFRQERRVSYRETGDRNQVASYSRELGTIVEVLVCLSCGHVQDEETIIS